jgi:hypothetical protein
MHDIHMAEVTEDFARCWNAAGLHIQNQAQGPLQSWLRAHLNPPFLEHLSFRLGNQLFFIQLEDVDGRLETPGNPEGLLAIAEGCAGHACLMPMRRVGVDWEPTELGWGLVDARTRKPIDPPALISDEKIVMTDWELQDFAVQVVRDELTKEGRELMSWNGNPGVNPSLWFAGDAGPEWVIVRTRRGLAVGGDSNENFSATKDGFRFLLDKGPGHYAAVAVINASDPSLSAVGEPSDPMPLYRGHGMYVDYKGMKCID